MARNTDHALRAAPGRSNSASHESTASTVISGSSLPPNSGRMCRRHADS